MQHPLNETWGCTLAKKDDPLSRARRRFKSWLHCRFEPWRVGVYGGIRVHYKDWLEGGGSPFGQEMIPFLRDPRLPRQVRVFEWRAGPAFIGFSMLGHGLCEALCLADINPMAVRACRRTIADNELGGRVTVYHSDNLSAIPIEERGTGSWATRRFSTTGRSICGHTTGGGSFTASSSRQSATFCARAGS